MKKNILVCMLVASSSAFAALDNSLFPSDLKCQIVQSVGGKEIKNVTLSTSEQPAHVINEDVGKSHVLSIMLSGDYYPQTSWVKLFSGGPNVVFSTTNDTYNMCDTIEIHGTVLAENIEVSYNCDVICTPRE